MIAKLIFVSLLPFFAIIVHKIYLLEVNPTDFACHHQKQIKGDHSELFEFLIGPPTLEKVIIIITIGKEMFLSE